MKGYLRKLLCAVLALCLVLPSLLGAAATETEPSVPETTGYTEAATPETTAPTEETHPETTAPAEPTAPETSVPAETTVPETTAPTEPTVPETTASTEPTVPETTPATEALAAVQEERDAFAAPYHAYFGLLHAHTDISDGLGTVEEAFLYAAQVEDLDFFAVTDHSDSFDNAAAGSLTADGSVISAQWAAGKAAAAAVTGDSFLGLFGFEMSWPEDKRIGHITTFGTPGWASWEQEAFSVATTGLKRYYEALTAVPGAVSQFCHPGERYGAFDRFGHWQQDYDRQMQLLEVSSGEEGTSFDQYDAALDAGWHVAPTMNQNNHQGKWGDADDARTVVLAEELTEEAIFDAIRSRRVYATQDRDLQLYFSINGRDMGETIPETDSLSLSLTCCDPTDGTAGKVEVITEKGQVLASRTLEGPDLTIPLAAGFRYYYLRITQPDGDIAVTAPVWVDLPDNVEILSFTAETPEPDQGDPVTLKLTLGNGTRERIAPEAIELYLGETRVHAVADPQSVPPGGTRTYDICYTHPEAGSVTLRALVRARGDTFEETLELTYRPRPTVTGLLIDGSHENGGLEALTGLKVLASEAGMTVTTVMEDLPRGGDLLLIQHPKTDLEGEFVQDVKAFLEGGGKLILVGPGSEPLLQALGSGLALGEEPVPEGTTKDFNRDQPWCKDIVDGQYFTYGQGTAVTGGQWLVRKDSQVLLAWEETSWGGGIFLSGCDLFFENSLAAPDSRWQLPQANRTILQAILGKPEPQLPRRDIREVRQGLQGQRYRVRGFVTAGTSNEYNRFPNTIYIQDDTGGIAVTGFDVPKIQVGAPMELVGVLAMEGENPVLRYEDHQMPGGDYYYHDPDVRYCKSATDYDARGGQVVKIQGKVTELTKTQDKKGICRLTVKDSRGDTAIVEIEDAIASGSTGKNTLAKDIKKDRTVRVIGLLHINAAGERVLRVRDCDEVVYVPPRADPTNPKTGDRFWWLW